MGSQIGSKTNVKIYVLNLMMAVGYPLDFNTLNEALRQTDFIDYFDFADAFHTMEDDGLLEASGVNRLGEPCYAVTAKGACVVESMRGTSCRLCWRTAWSAPCATWISSTGGSSCPAGSNRVPEGDAISSARSPSGTRQCCP